MPIWVMGGANTMLSTEGVMLEGVNVGGMQSDHGLENGGVTIHMIQMELSKLVGGVEVTVQQQREDYERLKAGLN